MGELEPCPFCGGAAELHHYAADECERWFAKCGSCGAVNGEANAESEPDHDFAVESWNRRANHPQPVTPTGGEVAGYVDPEADFMLPRPGGCVLSSNMLIRREPDERYTLALYTNPPVADAALDDARFEWLGQQMRSCTTYMDGSRAFDAGSFAMRKHNLRGRTIREAIDAAMSEDAALNQRGGVDHG